MTISTIVPPDDVAKNTGARNHHRHREGSLRKKLSGEVRVITPGERLILNHVTVEAMPAYNTNKDFHPRKNGWLGFIIDIDGVRIYHAG